MLTRGTMRQSEIAARLALGASRTQVVRLLLADSLLVVTPLRNVPEGRT
jgi:hypothetical protein